MTTPVRIQRLIAVFSVILFAGKLWAWYLTRSVAILTDALESIVNVITGLIGLYSVSLAARPRDANHPYGHGKAEFVSAAVEGTLIAVSGFVIIYAAVVRLIHPDPVRQLDTGIIITGVTGVLNFIFGTYAIRIGTRHRSMTVEAAGKHLRSDAWSTLAVVAGLVLLLLTGWQWLDSVGGVGFAVIIVTTGYRVLRKSLAGIMDETDQALVEAVIAFMQEHRRPQWIDLHNLRVIRYGDALHMDVHLTVPWYHQVQDADAEIHQLEELIRSHFGSKVELFVHVDACMPYQCRLCAVDPCPVRQEACRGQLVWSPENVLRDAKHGRPLDDTN